MNKGDLVGIGVDVFSNQGIPTLGSKDDVVTTIAHKPTSCNIFVFLFHLNVIHNAFERS
jgi:hypothetical protein